MRWYMPEVCIIRDAVIHLGDDRKYIACGWLTEGLRIGQPKPRRPVDGLEIH